MRISGLRFSVMLPAVLLSLTCAEKEVDLVASKSLGQSTLAEARGMEERDRAAWLEEFVASDAAVLGGALLSVTAEDSWLLPEWKRFMARDDMFPVASEVLWKVFPEQAPHVSLGALAAVSSANRLLLAKRLNLLGYENESAVRQTMETLCVGMAPNEWGLVFQRKRDSLVPTILHVCADSAASAVGIAPGDVILSVNGKSVEIDSARAELRSAEDAVLGIQRKGARVEVQLSRSKGLSVVTPPASK